MRGALHGLTTRGRSFLAAGVAAAACAVLLGQRDLMRVGVLLAALPLVAAWAVGRTRYKLACLRRLEPGRIPAGRGSEVVIQLDNLSRLPTGLLLVEDHVPYVLGSRPRFVLDRVEARGRRYLSYSVRSDIRGRFAVGPLGLRVTDPFGLCEVPRSFTSRDTLVVTPVVEELPVVHLGGEWSGSGESRSRSVASAGEDDVATREYRHGDDLRRVHWRATARYGELMVRREEQPWQTRATVLLDSRELAHRGEGPGSSFEWAVSAVASISLHLLRRGYAVRFVTDTGGTISSGVYDADGTGSDFEGLLLDSLAVVEASPGVDLHQALRVLRRGGGDGLVVAVTGLLDGELVQDLARARHGSSAAVAVLLDAATWSGPAPAVSSVPAQAALLATSGWRVVTARSGDRLPDLWPRVARGAESAASPRRASR
jgi:uncharacterized protein (DUF58 family)